MSTSDWGLWRSFNTLGDYLAAVFCLVCLCVSLYTIYYHVFRHWNCDGCGKPMVGSTDPLTGLQTTSRCGECCGWRSISHAEYNRMFSVPNKLRRVK